MATHLTKPQRAAIGEYLRDAADALELRDWTVFLELEPADQDANPKGEVAWAEVTCIYGRKHAHVAVAEHFTALGKTLEGRRRQRHILVHEMTHAILGPLQDHVRIHLPNHLGQQGYDIFYAAFYQHLEYAVDQIAAVAAKHLPLPNIPV